MRFVIILWISLSLWSELASAQLADVVYTNGRIYTVDEKQSSAEAVAIKDGKFIVVGSADDAKAVTGDATKVVALGGKLVLPGLHDQHVHLEQAYKGEILGEQLLTFPPGVDSPEAAAKLLKDYAAKNPDSQVLLGRAWSTGFSTKYPTSGWATPSRIGAW